MVQPIWRSEGWREQCRLQGCRAQVSDLAEVCEMHFAEIGIQYLMHRRMVRPNLQTAREALEAGELRPGQRAQLERERRRAAEAAERSVVYYVRIGDHVKIGFTCQLKQRLSALRVDPENLLATEPGSREKERERHLQFAAERVGKREDFNPSRRLLAHIEALKAEHGEPVIAA